MFVLQQRNSVLGMLGLFFNITTLYKGIIISVANNVFVKMLREAAVAQFKILSRHMPVEIEEKSEGPLSSMTSLRAEFQVPTLEKCARHVVITNCRKLKGTSLGWTPVA
jgi:hypothetical protein